MGILSGLRRMLFPTMAERMEDMGKAMGSMVNSVASMQRGLDAALTAQGLRPCAWCLARTRGEVGGAVDKRGHVSVFCSVRCRAAYEAATGDDLVTCAYCHDTFVKRSPECTHCGAPRAAAS